MERKLSIIIIVFLVIFPAFSVNAQKVTKVHDKSKLYQLRSMEVPGQEWNFHPGFYYALLHSKYAGSGNILKPKFKESKSDIGRIGPTRLVEVTEEALVSSHLTTHLDSIKPIAIRETTDAIEREADAVYDLKYADVFSDLIKWIDYYIELSIEYNIDGAHTPLIEAALDERKLLKEEINYLHKTGPDYQMEQAKRQLGYEDVETRLRNLTGDAYTVFRACYSNAKNKTK